MTNETVGEISQEPEISVNDPTSGETLTSKRGKLLDGAVRMFNGQCRFQVVSSLMIAPALDETRGPLGRYSTLRQAGWPGRLR